MKTSGWLNRLGLQHGFADKLPNDLKMSGIVLKDGKIYAWMADKFECVEESVPRLDG